MRLAFTSSAPDFIVLVPDYHPDYGLDDATRARVLHLVVVERLPVKEVAAACKLHPSTVYKWMVAVRKGL